MLAKLKGLVKGGSSSASTGPATQVNKREAPRGGVDYDAINKTLDRALFTPQYDACGSILVGYAILPFLLHRALKFSSQLFFHSHTHRPSVLSSPRVLEEGASGLRGGG